MKQAVAENDQGGLLSSRHFQSRFMLYVSIFVGLAFSAMYTSNLLFFGVLVELGADLGLASSHPYFEYIEDQKHRLLVVYLGVCSVAFVILFLAGLVLIQRILGPVRQVQAYFVRLNKEGAGVPPLALEDKYFFPELEETVNATVASFPEVWMPAPAGPGASAASEEEGNE